MRRLIALLLVAAPVPGAAVARPAAATLCHADEQPLFACPLGTRLVAICGGGGSAIYRFGRPGRIDLQATGLGYAQTAFSGGGETQISFTRAGTRYIVFDRRVRTGFGAGGQNDPQFSAGVVVQRSGRTLSTRLCRSDASIAAAAAQVIPAAAFVRH